VCLLFYSILLRPQNRWIHNLMDIKRMIIKTGLVGTTPAVSAHLKIETFESMTFLEQVRVSSCNG
jgi:hypothetical protein